MNCQEPSDYFGKFSKIIVFIFATNTIKLVREGSADMTGHSRHIAGSNVWEGCRAFLTFKRLA